MQRGEVQQIVMVFVEVARAGNVVFRLAGNGRFGFRRKTERFRVFARV
jgi:predicted transcriptional regulator